MGKLWAKLQGWKTVIGYILANVLGAYPTILQAAQEVLNEPSRQNLINLAVQILMVVGISSRILKNIK